MDVSVALSSGELFNVLRRGTQCPCEASTALLTSSADGQTKGALVIVQGLRPLAANCLELAWVPVALSPLGRGLPQVMVVLSISAQGELRLRVTDMASGRERVWTRYPQASARGLQLENRALWSFQLPDPLLRHSGYTLGSHFLRVVEAPVKQAEGEAVDPEATAGKVWPCGFHLARYAAEIVARSRGGGSGRALELGAGQGLVGMALAAAGMSVTCTDLDENLPLLQENLRANGLTDKVEVTDLDWRCPASRARVASSGDFDVVFAADCVFWPPLFEPFLECLADVLKQGATAYVALVHRLRSVEDFMARLRQDFEVQEMEGWCAEAHTMSTPRLYVVKHRVREIA
eukprot:TRINITY_DN56937_c0_g1_i1.p1 TRINITY_DN56937_c0_g1~~TRINITY_DN56937_c0_g1_i1.p1  ORF type:complete len:399 (+),score=55.87 TRINITY_DN56937_c0_g1_i1:159-1199(+)